MRAILSSFSRDQLEDLISTGEQHLTRILRCRDLLLTLQVTPRLVRVLEENERSFLSLRAEIDGLIAKLASARVATLRAT